MSVKTSQSITALFTTQSPGTEAAADATGTPTGVLYLNGTANGATVTVTKISTGLYKAVVTMPTLAAGDVVSLVISATVESVAGQGVIWSGLGDTARESDVAALIGTPVNTGGTASISAILGDFANTNLTTRVADIHTDVAENQTDLNTVIADVAAVHTHVGTIDGHITADYTATEKSAIDLLDDAAGGLVDIHTDVAAVKSETALIVADTNEIQLELADGGRTDLILDAIGTSVIESAPENMTASANSLDRGTAIQVDGTSTGGTASTFAATYIDNASYLAFAPLSSTATVNGILALGGFMQTTVLCGDKRASQVTVNGAMTGNGRFTNIYAYNYDTAVWDLMTDSITRIIGTTAPVDKNYTVTLLAAHQKNLTVGDGEVLIGFGTPSTQSSDRIRIDQLLVRAVAGGATTSDIANAVASKIAANLYDGGVTIDTISGIAGTAIGVNGTPTNPVLGLDDALIIASELGVKRLYMRPDSVVTLTHEGNFDYWRFIGKGLVSLNDASINDARFEGCESISGVGTGDDADFDQCNIGDVQLGSCVMYECSLTGTITTVAAGVYTLVGSVSGIPGTATPNFVFAGTGDVAVGFRNYSGGIHIQAMTTGDRMSLEGQGQLKIHTDCSGGTIACRGAFTITDEVVSPTPGFKGTLSDVARWAEDQTLTAIEADTNELQLELADGGRTDLLIDAIEAHVHVTDGHITADYGSTEKAAIDLLDDAVGGLLDIHTDVGTAVTNIGTVDTVVDGIVGVLGTPVNYGGTPTISAILGDPGNDVIGTLSGGASAAAAAAEEARAAAAEAAGHSHTLDDRWNSTKAGYLDQSISSVSSNVTSILQDTSELQLELANGGRTDLLIDAILADTSELQTEFADGGRLDLLIDSILEDTGTTLSGNILLALKVLRNKVVTDPSTGVMTIFDDNGTTPLYTAQIWEDTSETVPFDGVGANVRERLE